LFGAKFFVKIQNQFFRIKIHQKIFPNKNTSKNHFRIKKIEDKESSWSKVLNI